MMIPAHGSIPSAADPEIAPRALANLSTHEEVVVEALTTLDNLAQSTHQQSMDAMDDDQRLAIVEAFKPVSPAFIQLLQAAVITSYYQDDRVLQALGLPTRAPHPGGYPVHDTDWSLLDAVRGRKPFYREVGEGDG